MGDKKLGLGLTGNYRVRVLRSALDDVSRLCHRVGDRMRIRRNALKLRYWPEKHAETSSRDIIDLDWEWVRALPGLKIGELRIHEVIGGNDNLRVLFFVGPPEVRDPLPMIWILRVIQKKRNDFSAHDLALFRARRLLTMERFYT